MEFTHGPVVPRDAATVMLLRDAPCGIEVLLLRKTIRADFAGGAHVFPGGALDPADRSDDALACCAGLDDTVASAALEVDGGGLAFWVAAVRECFEEAGILLAYGPGGELVSFEDPGVAARFDRYRRQVEARELALPTLCDTEGLRLAADAIHYVSHWITPEGAPRRYDTRFFVAAVPPSQVAGNDGSETVENVWITPADALAKGASGEFQLIFPTIANLETLGRFARVDDVIAEFDVPAAVPTVAPRVTLDGDGFRFFLPGQPGYETAG